MPPKVQNLVAVRSQGGVLPKHEALRQFKAAKTAAHGLLAMGTGVTEVAGTTGIQEQTVKLWLSKLIKEDYNITAVLAPHEIKRERPVSCDERVHARLKAELQPASKKDPGCLMRAAHASIVINPIPGIGCPARDTLHRALKQMGWGKLWRWGRIVLTDEMKRQRLAWCRRYRGTDWTKWVISDEKMWEKGKVLRRLLGKFYYGPLDGEVRGKDQPKQGQGFMKWAAIGFPLGPSMRTPLCTQEALPENHVSDKDGKEKKGGGINNQDYTDVLQLELIPLIQKHAKDARNRRYTVWFQQDGASIHGGEDVYTGNDKLKSGKDKGKPNCLGKVKEVLAPWQIRVPLWAPHSPDLSPIEMLWDHVQRQVAYDPHAGPAKFKFDVEVAWNAIPASLIEKLIMSMDKRIEACIAANGDVFAY